jgi:sugar/nucleoside kinase (ribokinase family)
MPSSAPHFDVAGLGNALVDTLVTIDDQALVGTPYQRGIMHPVPHSEWEQAFARFQDPSMQVHAGGSAANTIAGLGLLGARTVFRGQVGDDDLGRRYGASLDEACGSHALAISPDHPTGACLALVSRSDSERTMLVDLGAAPKLSGLGDFETHIRRSKVFHVTGYAFLEGPIRTTAFQALDVARKAGVRISLDVADPFVVAAIRDDVWRILREYASVAFMNHEEAAALCGGAAPERAVHEVAEAVETTVVKLGSRGSLVKHHGQLTPVGIHTVQPKDTTGAGDAYAAGFLYGYVNDWSAARSGRLGARIAAMTVAQVGGVYRDLEGLAAAVDACKEQP